MKEITNQLINGLFPNNEHFALIIIISLGIILLLRMIYRKVKKSLS